MLRVRSRRPAALVAGALLLVACADDGAVAPSVRPSLDLEAPDAGPDSGVLVVRSSDGPPRATTGLAGALGLVDAAATPEPYIRIGVIPQATEIHLGAAGAWTLRDKATQLALAVGSGGSVRVTIAEVATSHYRLQVMCGSTPAVAARKAAAEALGHATFTQFVEASNCTRLYLGEFAPPPANTFGARTTFKNLVVAQGLAESDAFWRIVVIGGTVYRVEHDATVLESVNPVVLAADDGGVVTIGGRNGATMLASLPYRGRAEARQSGVALAGINELPMEQYLYGVVPRELGPVQYPELEAQKAQAVAARTYALRGLRKRESEGYDLLATTTDQVYGGYGSEHPVSSRAVNETRGIAMRAGGALIDALFSSTSGGHTADSEESFANVIGYLRGVPDAQRGQALAHVPSLEVFRAHANPRSLRAMKESDFESDWASLHRWTFEWTIEELGGALADWLGRPVGPVRAINVLERGPSGRVVRLEYVTDTEVIPAARGVIRQSLQFVNASGGYSDLPSTLFFVEPILDRPTKQVVGYRVFGGGFGHGVGLAQTGAVGMAQKGHSYEEILRHYYRGIDLAASY